MQKDKKQEFRKIKSLKELYEINENGVLRNVETKKIVKGHLEKNGYIRVRIENKKIGKIVRTTIHQLVAEAFIPNPENKPEVNHKDLNKQNNHYSNLEWNTHSENMKHAYKNGVNQKPLRNHSTNTRKKVICVELNKTFESISEAGAWLCSIGKIKTKGSAISGISAVLHNKRKTLGNYKWRYADDNKEC